MAFFVISAADPCTILFKVLYVKAGTKNSVNSFFCSSKLNSSHLVSSVLLYNSAALDFASTSVKSFTGTCSNLSESHSCHIFLSLFHFLAVVSYLSNLQNLSSNVYISFSLVENYINFSDISFTNGTFL